MTKFQNIKIVDYQLGKKIYYIILIFSFIWLFLIFLAPLFVELGGIYEKIASLVYIFFSKVCHQNDERSFHLLEHKLGVCSRCVWVYIGFFWGTSFYPVKYKLSNTTPPVVWILLIGFLILTIDVVFDVSGIMSNSFLSRSITGFIIGFILPFYIIPGFVKFFYEVHSFFRNKISTY